MSFYGSIYANTAAIYDNIEAINDEKKVREQAISDLASAYQTKDSEIENRIIAEESTRIDSDNAINGRIDSLTSQVSDNKVDIDSINNKIGYISDDITVVEMINNVQTDVNNLTDKQDNLSDRINTIEQFFKEEALDDGIIDTLKEIQNYIEDDGKAATIMVDNIEKNAKAINKETEDRENAIDEVKGIIGTVPEEKTVVNLIDEVKGIIGTVPEGKTVINLIDEAESAAESAAEKKVKALADGQVTANTNAINNIKDTIGITSGNENSLIDLINANTNNITDIDDTIGKYDNPLSISDRLNSLDIITTESSTKIDLLTTQTSDLSTRVDNLENSNNNGEVDSELATKVETNTQNIGNIQNLIGSETDILENDTIRGSINDHTSRISTLENDIENINTDIVNIGNRIDNLEENINNSGSSTFSTTIAFYLLDALYEASGSMTWQDWVYSGYNTSNYYTRHTSGQWPLRTFILKDSNNNYYSVKDTDIDEVVVGVDIIVSSLQYDLIPGYVFNIVDPEGYFSTKTYFIPATMTWRKWVSSPYSRNEYEINAAGNDIQTKAIRDGETYGASINGISDIDNLPDYSITEYTLGTEWVP